MRVFDDSAVRAWEGHTAGGQRHATVYRGVASCSLTLQCLLIFSGSSPDYLTLCREQMDTSGVTWNCRYCLVRQTLQGTAQYCIVCSAWAKGIAWFCW